MNIDILSLSGHKFYGPKGIGAMYLRKGIKIKPLIHGGQQERNRRAGTENVPGIVGMGLAAELAAKEMPEEIKRLEYLRDKIIKAILEKVPHSRLNGHPTTRLPGNANISFEFVEGESILLLLDYKGICASSGSACTSGSLDPSHVLLAIGLPHEKAHGSVRISIGHFNTEEQVDYLINELPPIIERMRSMSPLYEEYLKNNKD
jgi:cysteine desulfurase